jgi:hypothetical protein
MIRTISLVALPLLVGCGSSVKLSGPEARHTYESLNRISTSVILQALDSVLNGGDVSLSFDSKDLTVKGRLGETADFSGDIDVDGRIERPAGKIAANLDLTFDNVEMESGAIFDGGLGFDFSGDDSINLSKLKYKADLAVLGDFDVSGSDRGRADVDYDVSLDLNGAAVNVDGKGDISGHDISGWGEVISLLGF